MDKEEIYHSILLREHYRNKAEKFAAGKNYHQMHKDALDIAMAALEDLSHLDIAKDAIRSIREILK